MVDAAAINNTICLCRLRQQLRFTGGAFKILWSEPLDRKIYIVIRLTGTNEKEGQKLLEEAGIPYEISMEKAAKKAVDLCNELKASE